MRIVVFILLFLVSCQGQRMQNELFAGNMDTVQVKSSSKEKISVAGPAQDLPLFEMIGNDTVYNYVYKRPIFSVHSPSASVDTDVENYVQNAVKDIHIGEGISYISFVVNKVGLPCHVSIVRSARNNVPDVGVAERMDSIACEVVSNMPYFIPATVRGDIVNYRMNIRIVFK